MVAGYAYSSDPAAPNAAALIRAAVERIEIAVPNSAFPPGVVALLRERAADGCRICIIIEDPDAHVEALLEIDAIEIRASPAGVDHILYRADEEMLLALRNISFADQSPPLIHLRQATYGGLFDRLANDFDERWLKANPLTKEQLHIDPAETALMHRADPVDPSTADPPPYPATPVVLPADPPRRWPRRPS